MKKTKFGNVPTTITIANRTYHMRSKLECRFAQLLEWWRVTGQITYWEYEPYSLFLEDKSDKKRPVIEYVPDFRVIQGRDIWFYECKGMLQAGDFKKMKRLRAFCDAAWPGRDFDAIYICMVFASKPKLSVTKANQIERYCHRVIYNANTMMKQVPLVEW